VLVPATELINDPPVRARPLVERSPPCPARIVPFENVLVAVLVWRMELPVMVSPLEDKSPAVFTPPLNVEVAVLDATLMMPEKEVEALSESMAKMGVDEARDEVAMVNAYLVFAGIVVVALLWYDTVRLAALDEEMVMRFESRYVLPATERREPGVVVPMPKFPVADW